MSLKNLLDKKLRRRKKYQFKHPSKCLLTAYENKTGIPNTLISLEIKTPGNEPAVLYFMLPLGDDNKSLNALCNELESIYSKNAMIGIIET